MEIIIVGAQATKNRKGGHFERNISKGIYGLKSDNKNITELSALHLGHVVCSERQILARLYHPVTSSADVPHTNLL